MKQTAKQRRRDKLERELIHAHASARREARYAVFAMRQCRKWHDLVDYYNAMTTRELARQWRAEARRIQLLLIREGLVQPKRP